MKRAIDSSVIIAALDGEDPDHKACRQLLLSGKFIIHPHALSETFSTLTGGRLSIRIPADEAARLIRQHVTSRVSVVHLELDDLLDAYDDSTRRGIRGGGIYDYLHLAAARKGEAKKLYTLDVSDFRHFHREGDPEVVKP